MNIKVTLLKNKWFLLGIEVLFFVAIFIKSTAPLRDFDIWFHLKSGEIIAKMGIIHYDVFSYRTAGREWYPYEWLFQVTAYYLAQLGGFTALRIMVGIFMTIQLWFLSRILRDIVRLNAWLIMGILFFFYSSVFEFVTARPHLFAYAFLIINVYLMLLYVCNNKNRLWITIPITIAWANLHGSIFVDIAFFGSFAGVALINYWIDKNRGWLTKTRTLATYTGITAICSVLPPLWFTQYKLLLMFFVNRTLITQFIDEWTPLIINPIPFYVFTGTMVVILGLFLLHIKEVGWKKLIWTIPFIPLTFTAYQASRNAYIAMISLSILLGVSISNLQLPKRRKGIRLGIIILIAIGLGFQIWIQGKKEERETMYYPVNATQFIKQTHMNGNMYNEYGYGGYLLYYLYPQQKVFFDGRTDLYLCCEIPDNLALISNKYLPDADYKKLLYQSTWNLYTISYVVLRTERNTTLRKIERILNTDPQWSLVFWDDYTQIFVRHDGKNDSILEKYAARFATPYLRDPYVAGHRDEALVEYQAMDAVVKSAHTSNAIGYILMQQGKLDEARLWFNEALKLSNVFESPLMNLGELAVNDGNYQTAIDLYKKAQKIAPDRGLIYIRLGQLLIDGYNDRAKALQIWKTGVKQTADADAKAELLQLIQANSQ